MRLSGYGLIVLLCLGLFSQSYAKDLGSFGDVYAIDETDIVQVIHARLLRMQASGRLAQIQKNLMQQAKAKIDRPDPVAALSTTQKNHRFLVDPSITTSQPIRDQHGRVLVPKGKTFNPLSWIRLRTPLVFFNGDDKRQVNWAHKMLQAHPTSKLILVKGSIKNTAKAFPVPVYFDQLGKFVTRFHLTHVPAIVHQHGLNLEVDEVVP